MQIPLSLYWPVALEPVQRPFRAARVAGRRRRRGRRMDGFCILFGLGSWDGLVLMSSSVRPAFSGIRLIYLGVVGKLMKLYLQRSTCW